MRGIDVHGAIAGPPPDYAKAFYKDFRKRDARLQVNEIFVRQCLSFENPVTFNELKPLAANTLVELSCAQLIYHLRYLEVIQHIEVTPHGSIKCLVDRVTIEARLG